MLRGINGTFKGGKGIDRYQLLQRVPSNKPDAPTDQDVLVDLIEDYSLGEDSHVSLDYCIDAITNIAPEDGKHLLITLNNGVKYRLHDFYANAYASADRKTSSWEFSTKEGFSFRLKTQLKLPHPSVIALSSIPVSFQGTLTQEERRQAKINLHAGHGNNGARVELFETVAGKKDVRYEIRLPQRFELELRHGGAPGILTGSDKSERLTGTAGIALKGNAGADTYVIEDAEGGVVAINNNDAADTPAQDTLILPWKLSDTLLSITGSDLQLSHTHQPDSHVRVRLCEFMTRIQSRHLAVRDLPGQTYRLDITEKVFYLPDGRRRQESVAYLASGPLALNRENRLEVLSASQGGLTLDGRSRDLSVGTETSSVIIDHSGRGNSLAGTENRHNHLQVSGGNNSLYGGQLADELHGGSGHDYMAGYDGNDAYYVQGSTTIEDTAGEDTLILLAAKGTAQEEIWLKKTQDNALHIRFKNDNSRQVLIKDYFSPGKKIEHIVMGNAHLSHGDIDNLVNAMSGMPTFADRTAVQNNPQLMAALDRWSSLVTVPMTPFF